MQPCNHNPYQVTEHFRPPGSAFILLSISIPFLPEITTFLIFITTHSFFLFFYFILLESRVYFFPEGLLLSLSIIILRFIHVTSHISKFFSFFYYCIVFHCINKPKLFILLPMGILNICNY